MPVPSGAPAALRWRRVFPGQQPELGELRGWLAALLPDGPAREDVQAVAAELAANAVQHTASGRDGFFAVEITWHAEPPAVRIAVADGGAPTSPVLSASLDINGGQARGLRLVRALATRTGACGDERGRLVWAEVRWIGTGPAQPGVADGYEAAIRDVQAGFAARYPEAVIWFGRATLQWWAMTGAPAAERLLTAQSPADLSQLLDISRLAAPPPAGAAAAAMARPYVCRLRPCVCRAPPMRLPAPPMRLPAPPMRLPAPPVRVPAPPVRLPAPAPRPPRTPLRPPDPPSGPPVPPTASPVPPGHPPGPVSWSSAPAAWPGDRPGPDMPVRFVPRTGIVLSPL